MLHARDADGDSQDTSELSMWPELAVRGATGFRRTSELILDVDERPQDGSVTFARLDNVVLAVDVPQQPQLGSLQLRQTPQRWSILLPAEMSFPARIRLRTAQPLHLALTPNVAVASRDRAIVLEARHAIVHGEKLQFEPQTFKNTVGYWVNPSDWAEWHFRLANAGKYRVKLLQGCGQQQGGSRVRLESDGQSLVFEVIETGHFQNFVWRELGEVTFEMNGDRTLRLRVDRLAKQAVMDVRQIRLEPSDDPSSPDPRDLSDVAPDLVVPPLLAARAAPGLRVRQTVEGYNAASVYHALYLPTDWQPDRRFPVLIELTGNGPYENEFGDRCSGQVDGAKFGLGASGGYGYIWLTLPYLSDDGTRNVSTWWGDPPGYRTEATLQYWDKALDQICRDFGGDPGRMILMGFSRRGDCLQLSGAARRCDVHALAGICLLQPLRWRSRWLAISGVGWPFRSVAAGSFAGQATIHM